MRVPEAKRFAWRKSTYSGPQGGQCVEVGVTWRKSSHSTGGGGNCVEVAVAPAYVGVRDTKNRGIGQLVVAPRVWRAFVDGVVRG